LTVAADDVVDEFEREAVSYSSGGALQFELVEEPKRPSRDKFLGYPTGNEFADEGVEATHRLVSCPGDLRVTPSRSRSTVAWSSTRTGINWGARNAAIATDRASLGSFFSERPDPTVAPASQRRRDVHDAFTRREELLSQQVAQPTRRLDRPRVAPSSNVSAQPMRSQT
jgi:hypothetical protein